MTADSDVHIRIEGRVGRITLTRPQALNAISHDIVMAMSAALAKWKTDDDVRLVLVDAEGEKAFSAGGDLASVYKSGRDGDFAAANRFWLDEYRLNLSIARYPKPYVAVMDGIVMGGGVGVSAHGSHRIVTEKSTVAMPECNVGLITDVGGTYLLAKAPGQLGVYLGLTGARMTGEDAIHARFADLYIPRDRHADMKAAVIESGDVASLREYAVAPPPSALAALQGRIDALFAGETVPAILDALHRDGSEWAVTSARTIEKGSPLSAIMILSAIREATSLPVALRNEYRFVSRVLEFGDFLEGIRAIVIDKDRNPVWRHRDIASVPAELVALMRSEAVGGDPDFNS